VQDDSRRRYARPGEFEVPAEGETSASILESDSFKQRMGGELNAERKGPAPPSSQARPHPGLSPDRRTPAPPAPLLSPPRPAELTPRRSVAPPTPQALPKLQLNPIPRLSPSPRGPNPVPREVPPGVQRNPRYTNPAQLVDRAPLAVQRHAVSRTLAPLTSNAMARKRVSARFELLPDRKPLWDRLGWSAAGQLAALGLMLLSPMIFPQEMQTALKFDYVELLQPVTHIEIPPTPPPPPPPKIKPKVLPREPKPIAPKPKTVEVVPPELSPRQPHIFMVVKPQLPKVHIVEVKPVEFKPILAQPEIVLTSHEPKRPKEELKAPILRPMRTKEDLNAPSLGLGTVAATVVAAANKVQTGGLGDPNGVHGPANPSKAANINQAGSPNLPGGPGYGNGTGGAQGARGTLASASDGGRNSGSPAVAANAAVDILNKPNPAYSSEARTIRLEGDVVLEVVFLASGQVKVIGVLSGLGHGLDEAAIQAAERIRFRPALRNGQPIDFHARVRIEFRLAN
jgi:TonB family protein